MGTFTTPGTPIPTLGDPPNVPADFLKTATYLDTVTSPRFANTGAANSAFPTPILGQQATIAGIPSAWNGTTWIPLNPDAITYTPTWTSSSGNHPTNPASKVGYYKIQGGYCFVSVYMSFNAGTSGGSGNLNVGLPVVSSAALAEQILQAKLWCAAGGGNFLGYALIGANQSSCAPSFNIDIDSSTYSFWRSENTLGSGPGTGIPGIAGQFGVQTGGNIVITGVYKI